MSAAEGWSPDVARAHYEGREIKLYGKNEPQFDGLTSYRQDYPAHPLEARPHHGGAQYTGNGLPFDGQSTYNAEYPAHPLPERHPQHAPTYHQTGAPFDGTTTYASNYVPHALERQGPGRAVGGERVSLPFDGTTSYRSDYLQHAMPERAAVAGGPYQPPQVPFEGCSMYKGDFVPHPLEARQPHSPAAPRQSLPFDGTTTHGSDFRPYPIQPHLNGGARMGEYKLSGAKFEGMSESMDKYRAWAMDPANRRGGGPPPMRPSLPFDGQTTHREMFKGWQLPPKRPALGVQMVGDTAYVLIPPSAPIPAVGRQVFTTVRDGQTEMSILVLEGDFTQASRCNVLGQFDMSGLPPGPKGSARVEVTFHIDNQGVLNVAAMDLNTQRQEQWLRNGFLVARLNPN